MIKDQLKIFLKILFSVILKLNEVLSIFEKKIKDCKIEEAIHWAIELLLWTYY